MMRSIVFMLACAMSIPFAVLAQDKKFVPLDRYPKGDTALSPQKDTVQQWDLYDAIGSIFKKHAATPKLDSITSKPVISIVPAIGYTLQTRLAVTLAGNIAFRSAPDARVSSILINIAYTQARQLIVPIRSNIWTNGNDYNFVGDFRYYKYPQSTFGLGSSSDVSEEDPMDYSFIRFHETGLKRITGNFFLGMGYALDAHLNVSDKGTLSGAVPGYHIYGAEKNTLSSGFTLNSLFDNRDNAINPSRGFYAALEFRDNRLFLGSTSNWKSLIIDLRKYYRLPGNSDNIIAFWSYNWLVLNGDPPYLDLPATTWEPFNTTGRGYIQGRFRGAQMVYMETEYRFRISRNGLLGGVFFLNAQSFSAAQGTRMQAIQPAFGPGIRLKLNKVSKTNISIDYGMGREGSRGVFINVGEVF